MTDALSKFVFLVFVGAGLTCAPPAWGLEAANVLVLYNSASPDGLSIATHYADVHPGVHLAAISGVPLGEEVSWDIYLNQIRPAVVAALDGTIDCIVTTKGLPLRVDNPSAAGDPAKWNRYSSLESELTRIDTVDSRSEMGHQDWLLPDAFGGNELSRNPYCTPVASLQLRRIRHAADEPAGRFHRGRRERRRRPRQLAVVNRPGMGYVLDDDPDAPACNSDRMPALSAALGAAGVPYVYDDTEAFVSSAPWPVLGYVSHGRYGSAPAGYVLDESNGLQFDLAAGALFETYESYNAYSFQEGGNRNGQALLAEWLRHGGTVGLGNVEEPTAGNVNLADESRAVEMLLGGYTWAEAAWSSIFQLSYVNTVVGDPLMTYRRWVPGDFDLDGDVDADDIYGVKSAYNAVAGDGRYNPLADMNADGAVDLWDILYTQSCYTGVIPPGGWSADPRARFPRPAAGRRHAAEGPWHRGRALPAIGRHRTH